jgi:hypothetical protein
MTATNQERTTTMKRTCLTLLAAGALAGALASPAVAAAPGTGDRDVRGRACLDVTDGTASYSGTTMLVRLQLAAPACAQASYTLTVTDAGTTTSYQPSGYVNGDPVYTVTTSGATAVEISATTALGGHVFDVAPDSGTVTVTNDSSSGGLSMR